MALTTKEAVHFGVPKFDGEGEPNKLSFSPDGTRIAAGETRWTAVWTLDGKRVWTAAPGGHPVWLSPTRVLTTGFTNQPCVFAADSGEIVGAVNATAHDAVALGNGNVIFHGKIAKGESGLTKIAADGEVVAEEGEMLPFDDEARSRAGIRDMEIVAMCASADGTRIAVSRRKQAPSTEAQTLRVVDAHLKALWSKSLSTSALALDATGALLAFVAGGAVTLVDGATGTEKKTIAFEGPVHSLAFAPSGTLAVGLGEGRGVAFVDVASGKTTGSFVPDGIADDERVAALAFSPDGMHLAAGLSQRFTVRDMTTGRELGSPPAHVRGTHFLAVLSGPAVIVTRGPLSTKVWTLGSGELKATHAHEEERWPIPPLATAPGGVVFDAGADGALRLRDALRWEAAGSVTPSGTPPPRISELSVAARARRVAAVASVEDPGGDNPPDSTVRVLDFDSGAEMRSFGQDLPDPPPPPPDPELDPYRRRRDGAATPHRPQHDSKIALSPDGKLLAFTTRNQDFDEALHVVEVDTGRHLGHVVPIDSGVKTLEFLDDRTLLSGTPGNEVRASRIGDGSIAAPETILHDAALAALSVSRGLLASWNPTSGAVELRETRALSAKPVVAADRIGVTKLAFSDDERFLAAILQDGSVRVWSISR